MGDVCKMVNKWHLVKFLNVLRANDSPLLKVKGRGLGVQGPWCWQMGFNVGISQNLCKQTVLIQVREMFGAGVTTHMKKYSWGLLLPAHEQPYFDSL